MKIKPISIILLSAVFGSLLFLTFNMHSRSGYFNYHSEIWADKSGYYVYLPLAINYGFSGNRFPDSVDQKTGNGFRIENDKVITKYTYGVALMQLPFYLMADLLSESLGQERNGFSPVYHWSVNVAAVFYLMLGMILLYGYFSGFLKKRTSLILLIVMLAGTNLYLYSIDETGMSHIYSFALFSAFLNRLTVYSEAKKISIHQLFLLSAIAGLIIVVRPLNILFLLVSFFLLNRTNEVTWQWLNNNILNKNLLLIIITIIILLIPQIIYWKYAFGSYFVNPYPGEGLNWLSPQPTITLFSPNNGLFIYTPLFFVIIFALIYCIYYNIQKQKAIILSITLLVFTYILSSWWLPSFGCSFGARNYVEYYTIFILPIGFLYEGLQKQKNVGRYFFWMIVIVFVVYNLKLSYSFDECFLGKDNWDWNEYFRVLFLPV